MVTLNIARFRRAQEALGLSDAQVIEKAAVSDETLRRAVNGAPLGTAAQDALWIGIERSVPFRELFDLLPTEGVGDVAVDGA